jgi:Raf kinase inhibitor-like YbhB/YbcL family protein
LINRDMRNYSKQLAVLVATAGIAAACYGLFGNHGERLAPDPVVTNKNSVGRSDPEVSANPDNFNHQNNMMKLTSPLFSHNGYFPIVSTCDGSETNPPLEISGVPEGAGSLALILRDPDAPSGVFYHWVVWNIDPKTKTIAANSVPEGAIQGVTTDRQNFYIGPCPPSGTHRYYFDLYALDIKLNLPEATTAPELRAAMKGHIIATADLMAQYR